MISFLKNLKAKTYNLKANAGMTYVELIVVLSIFAIMSGVVLFNYGTFQARVQIKNYANDIAMQIVQAQKDAMGGKMPANGSFPSGKPSYGVYFPGIGINKIGKSVV